MATFNKTRALLHTNAKFITDINFLYMNESLVAAFSERPAHTSRK